MIVKSTIEQDTAGSDFDQVGGSGDLARRPVKCDPHPMRTPNSMESKPCERCGSRTTETFAQFVRSRMILV